MHSVNHGLLVILVAGYAVPACVDETPSQVGVRATEQPLQDKGVHYLFARGTEESPMFTFYDQNMVAIGVGTTSQDPPLTDIQWRGRHWTATSGGFRENGVAIAPRSADAQVLDTALTVFELGLAEVFAVRVIPGGGCRGVSCSIPSNPCTCLNASCSANDGSVGVCRGPSGPAPDPRPTPELPQL